MLPVWGYVDFHGGREGTRPEKCFVVLGMLPSHCDIVVWLAESESAICVCTTSQDFRLKRGASVTFHRWGTVVVGASGCKATIG